MHELIPATWTGLAGVASTFGLVIGAIIAWFATKSERKRVSAAHEETNKVYEQTIRAKDEFIAAITETHKAAVQNTKDVSERALNVLTEERDEYRKRSQDATVALHALGLKIKDYELRPDLTTLYQAEKTWHEQREHFYSQMFGAQQQMLEVMKGMIQTLDQVNQRAQDTTKALEILITKLEERAVIPPTGK